MLAHTTESRPTDVICDLFSVDVVACLDPAGFVISSEDIAVWLTTVFSDGETSPHQQDRDDHVGLGARTVGWLRALLGRK